MNSKDSTPPGNLTLKTSPPSESEKTNHKEMKVALGRNIHKVENRHIHSCSCTTFRDRFEQVKQLFLIKGIFVVVNCNVHHIVVTNCL